MCGSAVADVRGAVAFVSHTLLLGLVGQVCWSSAQRNAIMVWLKERKKRANSVIILSQLMLFLVMSL